jgi:hypothetical protein
MQKRKSKAIMKPQNIESMTRNLGKPQNWDDSKGVCESLPIRDTETLQGNVMVSKWKPTWRERLQLLFGTSIYLGVCGTTHPPVNLKVGEQ